MSMSAIDRLVLEGELRSETGNLADAVARHYAHIEFFLGDAEVHGSRDKIAEVTRARDAMRDAAAAVSAATEALGRASGLAAAAEPAAA